MTAVQIDLDLTCLTPDPEKKIELHLIAEWYFYEKHDGKEFQASRETNLWTLSTSWFC